jgi:hypothetical protein
MLTLAQASGQAFALQSQVGTIKELSLRRRPHQLQRAALATQLLWESDEFGFGFVDGVATGELAFDVGAMVHGIESSEG